MSEKNIEVVVRGGLCTGCGTCAASCSREAVTLVRRNDIYQPVIDERLCNNCGLCVNVCPGHEVDFGRLNESVSKYQPTNLYLGNFIGCYHGYVSDETLRYDSASGGLITGLLLYSLEKGFIDGAIVTKINYENLEPVPFLARTKEEIIESVGSKYCPVPLNISLRNILDKEGRYAVVGLPCHIHGLRKFELYSKKLRERIVMRLGIMCSHNLSFKATEYIISSLGMKKEEISRLSYRGKGWPGYLTFEDRHGRKVEIPYSKFGHMHFLHFFVQERCLLCCDQSCELADISFGDAWLKEFREKDNVGHSLIVVRTKEGEYILKKAKAENRVLVEMIDPSKVIQSQKDVLRFKKKTLNVYMEIRKLKRMPVPKYNTQLASPGIFDYVLAFLFAFNRIISKYRKLWFAINLLVKIELSIARFFNMIMQGVMRSVNRRS
ncbi:hypothetical protein MHLNE_11080 [Moorella humiferrea]|uniref:Coenzyme F420 hydrogenase/dehydrogenase, beta subunit C-terminal domain n=1 Tax=Neomoorella humiferrea TaxID=676965 RepID=UPI0030CAADBB